MKVNSATAQANFIGKTGPKKQAEPKNSTSGKDEIKAKIQAKFGVKVGEDKNAEKASKNAGDSDVVVSIDNKGKKKVKEETFGDVGKNSPDSEVTQEKLKGLLRSGGFDFNPKERAALNQILGK